MYVLRSTEHSRGSCNGEAFSDDSSRLAQDLFYSSESARNTALRSPSDDLSIRRVEILPLDLLPSAAQSALDSIDDSHRHMR